MTKLNKSATAATKLALIGAVSAFAMTQAAQAQTAAQATEDTGQLSEIIVTSQRRSENLQTVPIAVSAISATAVREQGIHDLSGVASRVPGLTFSPFSPGQNIVALRGVSSNDDGAGTDNSVAVFVDGVYSGRVSNINPEMFDVESIEVLRGPQGTLYGKNTIGGAIVINSTRPSFTGLDARFQVDVGNYNRLGISGLLSGPLSENLAGKFSFITRKRDGYVKNVYLGSHEQNDDTQAYRGQLLYSQDKLKVLLSGDYNKLDVADMGRRPLTQITGALGPIVSDYQRYCGTKLTAKCAANPTPGYTDREAWGVSAQVDYETAIGDLTSITAYRDSQTDWLMDSIGAPSFGLGDKIDDGTKQVSQEVRLSGDQGAFKYVGGVFYLHEKTDRTEIFDAGPQGDYAKSSQYTQNNVLNSYAAFGQVDWQMAEQWVLTVGARYTYEKKSIDNSAFAGDFPVIGTTFANSRSADWKKFTPKVVLSYHPDEQSTAYLSYSKGFKSGGFAAAPTTVQDTNPLKQELATNYEAGFKTELFDRTLRLNSAVFFTEYKDLQYQNFGPRAGVLEFGIFRTVNLAKAQAAGAELEFDWLPVTNLTISGSYGYLWSEYKDATIPTSNYADQDGKTMVRAPRNKVSLSGRYKVPLGDKGDLTANLGYRYTDKQRGELEPYAIQPSYSVVDGRLTWALNEGRAELSLWGKNLADKAYVSHVYTIGGEVIGVLGEPRMFGLSLTLRN